MRAIGFYAAMSLAALLVCLSVSPRLAVSEQSGGCVTGECHKGMLTKKFVHGPVAVEECGLCHRRTGKHAFTLAAQGEELCYLCHERGRAKNVRCLKCHDPHGSDLEFQLLPGAGKRCMK